MTDTIEQNATANEGENTTAPIVTPLGRGAIKQEEPANNEVKKEEQKEEENKQPDTSNEEDLIDDDEDDEDASDTYGKSEVSEVNDLASSFKRHKVTLNQALMLTKEAFEAGDASKLSKEDFEAIVGKENAKELYMESKLAVLAVAANRANVLKDLNALSGGDWNSLKKKAQAAFSKAELKEYQDLINLGGAARKMAIKDMIAKTSKSKNTPLLTGDNTRADDNVITSTQYKVEMRKIEEKYSRAGMLTAEGQMLQKALDERRAASIHLGIK